MPLSYLISLIRGLSCSNMYSFTLKIEVGSTNVRVGSVIFGNREYPNSATNTPAPSPEKTAKSVTEEAAEKMQHLTVSKP